MKPVLEKTASEGTYFVRMSWKGKFLVGRSDVNLNLFNVNHIRIDTDADGVRTGDIIFKNVLENSNQLCALMLVMLNKKLIC